MLTLKNINVIIIRHSGKRQKNTKKSHKKSSAKLIQISINFPKKIIKNFVDKHCGRCYTKKCSKRNKVHWKVNNERKEKPSEKENNKSYEKYETITMS